VVGTRSDAKDAVTSYRSRFDLRWRGAEFWQTIKKRRAVPRLILVLLGGATACSNRLICIP